MATATRVNPPVVAPWTRGTIALTPNVLSIEHWDRLEKGALFAGARRTDWARLLRRTFAIDVHRCLACGGRLRIVSVHEPGDSTNALLVAPGVPSDPPRVRRAREPTSLAAIDD